MLISDKLKIRVKLVRVAFLWGLFLFGVTACVKDPEFQAIVSTEEVLFVNANQVRLMGRLLSSGDQQIFNHGFQISVSQEFTTSIVEISLGEKNSIGRFIGEASELSVSTTYFYRAFIEIDGKLLFGVTKSFVTLSPGLVRFEPTLARAGDQLVIRGSNFSSDTEVFFNDVKAEIIEILFESQIKVIVPPISSARFPTIKVKSNGDTLEFDTPFEYVVGKWQYVLDFPTNDQLSEVIYFKMGSSFIMGLGVDPLGEVNNKIWSLDLDSWQWGQLSFTGAGVRGAFFSNGFFGTGAVSFSIFGNQFSNQFWANSSSDFTNLGLTPFRLYKSVGFTLSDKLYVLGGRTSNNTDNLAIFKYDPSTSNWTTHATSLTKNIDDSDNPYFTYGELQYFIRNGAGTEKRIVSYSPELNLWSTISNYPSENAGNGGVSIVLGDKVYVGLFNNREIWEYDIIQNKWNPKLSFPPGNSFRIVASFVFENKIYVVRRITSSFSNPFPRMALWSFDPESW